VVRIDDMASHLNPQFGDQIRDRDEGYKFKQLPVVRENVKTFASLSQAEKSLLDQLIQQEDPNLLDVINKSTSSDQLAQNLTAFVRARFMDSSADSSVVPMMVDSAPVAPPSPSAELFDVAFKKMSVNKVAVLASACRNIQKMLQNLRKQPTNVAYRKLNMQNIVVKKFVTDVPGALEFMQAVGFAVREEKKVQYMNIEVDAVNPAILERALELLDDKIKAIEAPAATTVKADGPRMVCTTPGCGFWGDPETEGMCSACARKKNLGSKLGAKPEIKAASPAPKRCTEGCGFFGAEQFSGMCSKCFTKKGGVLPPPSAAKLPEKKGWRKRLAIVKLKLRALHRLTMVKKGAVQKDKKRCWKCNKKVGITGIECRCMFVFCGKHRYPDEHECPFDYKHLQRVKLQKENALVEAKKFDKIDDP